MKALFTFVLISIVAAGLHAQDIIVMKDGSIVQSKVTDITSTEVKYKKFSNPDGPLYTINKSTILAINYENGEKETFWIAGQHPTNAETGSDSGVVHEIPVEADADNEDNVEFYNTPIEFVSEKGKEKDAKWVLWKYGVTQSSILSNKDIEVNFELRWVEYCCQYAILIRNKTDETIHIDLDKTRWVDKKGEYHSYYDDKQQTSITLGESSSGSIGLGYGIAVGGGSLNATTTTYFNNRYLDIPPHGEAILSDHVEAVAKKQTILMGEKPLYSLIAKIFFLMHITRRGGSYVRTKHFLSVKTKRRTTETTLFFIRKTKPTRHTRRWTSVYIFSRPFG